jgi:hypothetical protein
MDWRRYYWSTGKETRRETERGRACPKSSKQRYTGLFASMPNVSITKSSVKKPPHRFAAEGSRRRAINLLHSTAYSNFIPVPDADPALETELKALPPEIRQLQELAVWVLIGQVR